MSFNGVAGQSVSAYAALARWTFDGPGQKAEPIPLLNRL